MNTASGAEPSATESDRAARRAELAAGLAATRARIEQACLAAGRDPAGLTLVVVTKTYPASDIEMLHELGVRDIGESREQELVPKHAALAGSISPLVWHFIGRLQSNKARRVAALSDLVHSVDRAGLLAPLGRGAQQAGRQVGVLLQVSLDGDTRRGGVPIAQLGELAEQTVGTEGLSLRGVMAVAPLGADPREAFAVLPELSAVARRADPAAGLVSAGMSGDLEAAVACGATHLRVGSAILGQRVMLG